MSEVRLRVKEVAAELGESVDVVRNWLRDFREWIPVVANEANRYNEFPPEAVAKMKEIHELIRKRNFSVRQVQHFLATGEQVAPAAEDVAALDVAKASEVAELREMMLNMAERQEQFAKAVLERLDTRDKQLTQFITEWRHERMQQLPPPITESTWKFWKKRRR